MHFRGTLQDVINDATDANCFEQICRAITVNMNEYFDQNV